MRISFLSIPASLAILAAIQAAPIPAGKDVPSGQVDPHLLATPSGFEHTAAAAPPKRVIEITSNPLSAGRDTVREGRLVRTKWDPLLHSWFEDQPHIAKVEGKLESVPGPTLLFDGLTFK